MNVAGSYLFDAPPARVWPLLFDPGALINLIPGCQQLVQVSPGEYRGQIQIGVAAVGGTYEVSARLAEQQAPQACRFEGHISGATGAISGDAALRLKEVNGATSLDYDVQVTITGALATVPPRLVEEIAKTLIAQGLSKLNDSLKRGEVAADSPAAPVP